MNGRTTPSRPMPGTRRVGDHCAPRVAIGLNLLNLSTAAIQTGFGPFIAVWLTQQGWRFVDIGFALSLGTVAGLAAQLPGGGLVDHVSRKRELTAIALVALGAGAALMAVSAAPLVVWASQIEHALASSVLTPAIAALTLSLCGHAAFSQRLGINARYAALGSAGAAALLGLVAEVVSVRAVFMATAALTLPALASLLLIRPSDCVIGGGEHMALTPPHSRTQRDWNIFAVPALHIFAVAVLLFQFANAGMLPLALGHLTRQEGTPGWVLSATIVLPQLITAALSPWAGTLAQRIGRRPVLLVGFAMLPLRALLFALSPGAVPLTLIQTLDGISATVLGLMLPLIAADVTKNSGYMNLAIGSLGLAGGLGATFSTTVAGWIADSAGPAAAFTVLAAAGACATALLWLAMPETRPETETATAEVAGGSGPGS